jgi:ubiquitin-protein ligase
MMTAPQLRRLENEYAGMLELAQASSLVSFTSRGVPPVRYEVSLECGGVIRVGSEMYPSSEHRFTITLDDAFPMLPPLLTWHTRIFHPNIKPPNVCTGDIWYPALSLAELCTTLCELVQYKQFNIYSALDHDAATWIYRQLQSDDPGIPVDRRPVRDRDFEIEVRPHEEEEP